MTEDEVSWAPLGLTGKKKKRTALSARAVIYRKVLGGKISTHSKQPLKINLSEVYGGKQDGPRIGQK